MQETNIAVTVNEDLIRVDIPSGYIYLDAYQIYNDLKHIYAREDVKLYLDDSGFSETDIALLSADDNYIRAWMNAVANNECVAECKRQAAAESAYDHLPKKDVAKE